jgi:hypothetical protein
MIGPVARKAVYVIVFYGIYFNVLLFLTEAGPLYLSLLLSIPEKRKYGAV